MVLQLPQLCRGLGLSMQALAVVTLVGCGGGGTGDGGRPSVEGMEVRPNPAPVHTVARNHGSVIVNVALPASIAPGTAVYLGVIDPTGILAAAQFLTPQASGFPLSLTTKPAPVPGTTTADLKVVACRDAACREHFPGSPASLQLVITSSPNIEVEPLVVLKRSGAGPLPTASVAVSIPPDAGPVSFSVEPWNAPPISARFEGDRLIVETTPIRSGVYESKVRFFRYNSPYSAETLIRYEVSPPPGGEFDWRVSGSAELVARQGQTAKAILTVLPPTWIADPVTVVSPPSDFAPWFNVQALGENRFELSANATGLAADSYSLQQVAFGAGPYADSRSVSAGFRVDPVYSVTAAPPVNHHTDAQQLLVIDRATTAADLVIRYDMQMLDGTTSAVRWSAESPTSWFKPRRSFGAVGVDPLHMDLDPKILQLGWFGSREPILDSEPVVRVSIDRTGVVAREINPRFYSSLTVVESARLIRSPSGPSRLYVVGRFPQFAEHLRLTGARELGRRTVSDGTFGLLPFLVVFDVDSLVDGQPISLIVDSGLTSRVLTIPVVESRVPDETSLPLPALSRRPPVVSDDGQSIFWAEPGRIRVARQTAGTWTQSTVEVTDLVDFDLSADGKYLQAVTSNDLVEFDPSSLRLLRRAPVIGSAWAQPPRVAFAPASLRSIVNGIENLAWVSFFATELGSSAQLNWVSRSAPDGSIQRRWGQPMVNLGYPATDVAKPVGLLRSVDRSAVLSVYPESGGADGFEYVSSVSSSANRFNIPTFGRPVGISSGAARIVASDGSLWRRVSVGQVAGNIALGAQVPAGVRAHGWTISNDGSRVFAYASRRVQSGAQVGEADPVLLVFQVSEDPLSMRAALAQTIPLSRAANCSLPSADESDCLAEVHMTEIVGGRQLVISGRTGALVVPVLPSVQPAFKIMQAVRIGTGR